MSLDRDLEKALRICSDDISTQTHHTVEVLTRYATKQFVREGILTLEDVSKVPASQWNLKLKLPPRLQFMLLRHALQQPHDDHPLTVAHACHGIHAEQYLEWLKGVLSGQRQAEEAVENMVRVFVSGVANWAPVTSLQRFGSRFYGLQVPSSDVDIVLQLQEGSSRDLFLGDLRPLLKEGERCTSIKSVISRKHTIELRMSGLRIDLTACCGSPQKVHGPTQMSEFVKAELASLRPEIVDVAHLVVDCAKRGHACHSNKKEAIAEQLKGIHWILFVLAWSRSMSSFLQEASIGELTRQCFLHYLTFPFFQYTIDARQTTSYCNRMPGAPMWLIDPLRPDHNLLEHISQSSLDSLRERIYSLLKEMSMHPSRYWSAALEHWDSLPMLDVSRSMPAGCSGYVTKRILKDLVKAARNDDVALLVAAMDRGAPLHYRDGSGKGLLHVAAGHGSIKIVHHLVQNGLIPGDRDASGKTALDEARYWYSKCTTGSAHGMNADGLKRVVEMLQQCIGT